MNKNTTILYIDTTNSQQTVVELRRDNRRYTFNELTGFANKSQNVLPLIEKALRSQGWALKNITAIEINPGPGSFTGIRVGVSVANALGWALGIPINGKKIELPKYAESKFD